MPVNYILNAGGSNDTAAISAVLATIGSDVASLILPASPVAVTNSVTIPGNVTLNFNYGGGLSVNTGQTLNVRGPLVAPTSKIFYNATASQGTISFASNYYCSSVFYPQWWGAIADRVGTNGTNNRAAIQAAIVACETSPGLGTVMFTGQFLAGTTTGTEIILVRKGITLAGGGGEGDGIYGSVQTLTTIDMVRYAPVNPFDNQGFTVSNLSIISAGVIPNPGFPGAYTCTDASARHCLVLDASEMVGGGTMGIRFFHIFDSTLIPNFAGGAVGAPYGICGVGTVLVGNPTQSIVGPNNLIFNGIYLPALGDSVTIFANTFMLYNDLYLIQQSGTGTLNVIQNISTLRKGFHIENAFIPNVSFNNLENAEADSVGTAAGSIISIVGGVNAAGGQVHGNMINNLSPAPVLNGVSIGAVLNTDIDGNGFRIQATRYAISAAASNNLTVVGKNTYVTPTAAIDPAGAGSIQYKVYGFDTMPASGTGLGINLALNGNIRAGGAAGTAPAFLTDVTDTAQSCGYLLYENGVLKGWLLFYASLFGTAGLRNDIQLFNNTATGDLSFGTNGTERLAISAAGFLKLVGLPVYANNAAAISGGLVAGQVYRTGGDPDPVCVVH